MMTYHMLQHRRVGGGDGVLAGLGGQPPEQAHHHQHRRQQGGRAQDGHSDAATETDLLLTHRHQQLLQFT